MVLCFPIAQQEQFEFAEWQNNENTSKENFCVPDQDPALELCIPKLQMHVSVANNADIKNINSKLRNGVTHLIGTAEPGNEGNAVFFGHSSAYPWEKGPNKTVFIHLNKLQVGDDMYFIQGGSKWHYRIQSVRTVSPKDISVLYQDASESISTLITCWPPGTTLKRLVVTAQLQ